MATESLERAVASTKALLAKVNADNLGRSTPCASWDVRGLVNHIVGGMQFFNAAASGEKPPEGDADVADTDFVGAFSDVAKQVVAKLGEPGALEATYDLGFAQLPGSAFLGLASLDTFQHGWDLASALGESTDLDADLAAQLLAQAQASIPDTFRGPEGAPFGPRVEVAETAPAADQLAGFLGRQV
ncbi:MAG: TIGR03086 family metal-binding protein [Acidimicrobiales bacterium]